MASHPIYQFYAELDDYRPKIWRRFQVTDDITVARLGYILQVLFEMTASHLMAIEVPQSANFRSHWKEKYPNMGEETFRLLHEKDNAIWRFEIPHEDIEPFEDMHRDVKVYDATTTKRKVRTPSRCKT